MIKSSEITLGVQRNVVIIHLGAYHPPWNCRRNPETGEGPGPGLWVAASVTHGMGTESQGISWSQKIRKSWMIFS